MRAILLLFAMASTAFGQRAFTLRDQPFLVVATAGYQFLTTPTNTTATATNLSWWVGDNLTGTNATGKVTNWVDFGMSPNAMTNGSASLVTFSNAFLNGHRIVHFTSGGLGYLRSLNYTSSQPHEIFAVVKLNATQSSVRYLTDQNNSAAHQGLYWGTSLGLIGNNNVTRGPLATNVWLVLNWVHNATAGGCFTNNKSSGAMNGGTQTANGFVMGGNNGPTAADEDVAEMVTFFGTLGAIDAAGTYSASATRTDLYRYFTNKYAIIP